MAVMGIDADVDATGSTWKGVKILRSAGVSNTCQRRNAWLRSLMIFAASILSASLSSSRVCNVKEKT